MKRVFISAAFLLVMNSFITGANIFAQRPPLEEVRGTGVVLAKLSPPIYPPLARAAVISGEVRVEVRIRNDGSVASAQLLSGHPMLAQAALESAKKSQFECLECSAAINPYLLTYSFEDKDDGDCCDAYSRAPEVTQAQGRITIVDRAHMHLRSKLYDYREENPVGEVLLSVEVRIDSSLNLS